MNCKECLSVIEEYVEDGLTLERSNQTAAHIAACGKCLTVYQQLNNEREMYSRFLLKIKEKPNSWDAVREEMRKGSGLIVSSAGTLGTGLLSGDFFRRPLFVTMAALVVTIAVGFGLWYRTQVLKSESVQLPSNENQSNRTLSNSSMTPDHERELLISREDKRRTSRNLTKYSVRLSNSEQPYSKFFDSSEAAFNRHVEKCEMVLRSFRNAVGETDETARFDISYERRLAKQLLSESARFRREAQSLGDLPTENLLVDLEKILVSISSLPKKATSSDATSIKGRIQQSGIIGKLQIQSSIARASD